LARLELKAGHGAGKSTQKVIEEAVDKFCITARSLSLEMKPLPKALKAHQ
jgi:prolyl oligopeptidase